MHRAPDASTPAHGSSSSSASASSTPLDGNGDGHVCPFCGLTRDITEDFDATAPCPRCTLADTPTTRNATKARIGPWHVRQMRNPWAPGMRWETLLALIKRGQVTRDSVVRGPTTHQLWKRASEVKGLSREFGVCYSCGGEIDAQANLCPHCNRLQEPPANPNVFVETRELAAQGGATAAARAPAASPQQQTRSNGNAPRRRAESVDDDDDDPQQMDIGASTPAGNDVDDMLAADDPEAAAALARSVTSRPPLRPNRANPSATPPPAPSAKQPKQPNKPNKQQAPAEQSTPPAASRPVTLRPRQPGVDDALLTPQELAAAFQLNFTPPGGSRSAAPSRVDRSGQPRRKRSKLFKVFVLLLIVGIGAAVLMYLRPDLREQAAAWSDTTYASVKEFIASRTTPARPPVPPADRNTLPATRPSDAAARDATLAQAPKAVTATPAAPATRPAPAPAPAVAMPAPAQPSPIAIAPAPPPRTKTVVVTDDPQPAPSRETTKALEPLEMPSPDDAPITASAKATNPAIAPDPVAQPPVEIIKIEPPETAAAAAAAKPAPATRPAPPPPAKVWTNLSEAEDEARRLWRLAFDAEQNQDFVEAVSLYEQIKRLPGSVHPAGLEVRLSLAKKLMK